MRRFRYVAFGIGFAPFDWRLGDVTLAAWAQRMIAFGPFRFSWRGWL